MRSPWCSWDGRDGMMMGPVADPGLHESCRGITLRCEDAFPVGACSFRTFPHGSEPERLVGRVEPEAVELELEPLLLGIRPVEMELVALADQSDEFGHHLGI